MSAGESSSPAGLSEQLETKRTALRPFTLQDVDAVFAYSRDEEYARYQPISHPFTRRDAERLVAEYLLRDWETQPCWAITLAGDVIGIVSLAFEAEHRIAQLGYGVHKAHWGKGLAVECARAIIEHGFRAYAQLERFRAVTDGLNLPSHRVLDKLGFLREATLRSNLFAKGRFVDEAIYGLLRAEWTP